MLKLKKKLGVIMLFFGITAGFFSAGILSEWSAGSSVRAAEGDSMLLREMTKITSIRLYRDYNPDGENIPLTKEEEVLLKASDNLTLEYSFQMSFKQVREIHKILEQDEHTTFWLDTGDYLIPKDSSSTTISLEGIKGDLGVLHLENNKGYLTFMKDTLARVLEHDTGDDDELALEAGFFFGCSLGNPPAESDQNKDNRYELEAENMTILDEFGFYDLEKTPKEASLKKEGKLTGDTITWTIEYTPSQNKKDDLASTFVLRDFIDGQMYSYVDGSAEATQNNSKLTGDVFSCEAEKVNGGMQLTFSGSSLQSGTATEGNPASPITITYKTTISSSLLLPESGTTESKEQTLSNEVLLSKENGDDYSATGLSAEANVTLPATTWLKKTGTVNRKPGSGADVEWKVVITIPDGIDISEFEFTDTMKEPLKIDTNNNAGFTAAMDGTTINYGTPNINAADGTISATLTPGSGNTFPAGNITVTYNATLDESAYQGGESGSNSVDVEFTYGNTTYTLSTTVGVNGIPGVNTSLLTKENNKFAKNKQDTTAQKGYLANERSSEWCVTFNPNKANLSTFTLTDDLAGAGSDHGCKGAKSGHSAGMSLNEDYPLYIEFEGDTTTQPSYTGEVTIPGSNLSSGAYSVTEGMLQTGTTGTTGSKELLKITKKEDGNLVFEGNNDNPLGHTSVTFIYVAKVNDPCIYVGNVGPGGTEKSFTFKNSVSGTVSFVGNPSPVELSEASASAKVSSDMLVKGRPKYDYAKGIITWTADINESEMDMKNLVLTDKLQKGLTYVDDSLTIDGNPNHGAKVTTIPDGEYQRLTIELGDLDKKAELKFQTKVDPEALGLSGLDDITLNNHISMEGNALDSNFDVSSDSPAYKLQNHGLTKTGTYKKDDGLIHYAVGINPFGLELKDAAVIDVMDDSLYLDPSSMKLYKAEVSGTSGDNGDTKPTYQEVGDPIDIKDRLELLSGENGFKLKLPDGDSSFLLVYDAELDENAKGDIANKISFSTLQGEMGGEENSSVGIGAGAGAAGQFKKKSTLTLNKKDEDGDPLENVEFTLYLWENDSRGLPASSGVTDANGTLMLKGLKPGQTYELVETFPSGFQEHYEWSETLPSEITKTKAGTLLVSVPQGNDPPKFELTLENILLRYTISIPVVDHSGNVVPGSEFVLYEDPECTIPVKDIETAVTGPDGRVVFENVPYRSEPYYFKQVNAPDGYTFSDTVYTFSIESDGTASEITNAETGEAVDKIINVYTKEEQNNPSSGTSDTSSETSGTSPTKGTENQARDNRQNNGQDGAQKTNVPQTGDTSPLFPNFCLMLLSLVAGLICLRLKRTR